MTTKTKKTKKTKCSPRQTMREKVELTEKAVAEAIKGMDKVMGARPPPRFYPGSRVVDPRPPKGRDCGCKRAGIGIFNGSEIQRCDDCNLFEEDSDAANAVDHLLLLLGEEYREGGASVADAFDRLYDRTDALLAAHDALQEGYVNCADEDNVFAEPLRMVKAVLGRRVQP